MRLRVLGIFTSSIILLSGLVAVPAQADEGSPENFSEAAEIPSTSLEQQPLVNKISFSSDQTVDSSDSAKVVFKASTDEDVSLTNDYIEIVNADDDTVLQTCNTGTECSYEYAKQNYAEDPTFFARTTNLTSNSAQALNNVPTINISTVYDEVDTGTDYDVNIKLSQSIPFSQSVYLVDTATGRVIDYCKVNCEAYSYMPDESDTIVYKAYLADSNYGATNLSQLTNIVAESNTTSVSRTPFNLRLNAPEPFIQEGATFDLKAKLNQKIPYGYKIYMHDVTANKFLTPNSIANNEYCLFSSPNIEQNCLTHFEYDKSHQYKSYLALENTTLTKDSALSDLEEIRAESNTVTVKQIPFVLDMTTEFNGSTVKYHGTLNQSTNYYNSAIIDANTNAILQVCGSNKCDTTLFYPNDSAASQHVFANGVKFVVGRWSEEEDGNYGYEPGGYMYDIQASASYVPGSSYTPSPYYSISKAGSLTGGSNPSQDCAQTCVADPINAVTGEFWLEETDATVQSSVPLNFARYYGVSKRDIKGSLGYGWNTNYDFSLKPVDTNSLSTASAVVVSQENGSTVEFARDSAGNYSTSLKNKAKLQATGTGFTFIRDDKTSFVFNAQGKIVSLADLSGNTLGFGYSADKLTSVSNGKGQTLTIAWNAQNLISSVTTPNQRVTAYRYDTSGNLIEVTNPENTVSKYAYDSAHAVTSMTDPKGNVTSNIYDDKKRVTKQTDPAAGITSIAYAPYETSITNPAGRVDKHYYNESYQVYRIESAVGTNEVYNEYYEYNEANNKLSTTYPDGGTNEATYDAAGHPLQVKDRAGNITSYTYDALGNVLTETNAEGKTRAYTYNASGAMLSSTDFKGVVTTYELNASGQTTKIITPDGGQTRLEYNAAGLSSKAYDAMNNLTTMTYSSDGEMLSKTNAKNQTTAYSYDGLGRITAIKYADNTSISTAYDANGNPTSITDAKGKVTSYAYDKLDRPVSTTDALGRVTKEEYNKVGDTTKKIDPLNKATTYTYNLLGAQTQVTDAAAKKTYFYYNNIGQMTSSTDALGKTSYYNYDANGNTVSTVDANGVKVSTSFNKLNLPVKSVDVQKKVTSYSYDENSNPLSTSLPNGTSETNEYNSMGYMTAFTDSEGKTKRWEYNTLGQNTKFINTDLTETVYGYDVIGNLTTETRPDASVASYEYSTTNQVLKEILSDSVTEYTYDANGKITTEKQGTDQVDYTYDAVGNLMKRGPPVGNGVSYTYTARNQIASMSYPSGKTVNYTYNDLGQPTAVGNTASGSFSYAYNALGNLTTATNPNGTAQTYTYDATSQLTATTVKAGTTERYSKKYTYEKATGLLTSSTVKSSQPSAVTSTDSYTYDSMTRLASTTSTKAASGNYGYSASGNLTDKLGQAQAYNQSNQLVETLTAAYSLDGRGNRVSEANKSTGTVKTQYAYNQSNQLTKVTSGTKVVDYSYDANGLVKNKMKASKKDNFVWDYSNTVPLLLDDGDFEYIYTVGTAPVAQIEKSSGTVTYLHSDDLGSIVSATNASGAQVATYVYSAYGDNQVVSGLADPNHNVTRFGFAGEWKDADTGLYNLRARWYEPQTGTFLTRDPVEQRTHEAYSYASGNPLANTDPLGLFSLIGPFPIRAPALEDYISYEYEDNWVIGNTSDFSAEEVMEEFRNNPAEIFPFPVTGCNKFEENAICGLTALTPKGAPDFLEKIVNVPLRGYGTVRVNSTCLVTTFTVTEPGYFVPPQSKVVFSAHEEDGKVIFTQSGKAYGSWAPTTLGVKSGVSKFTWWQQKNTLKERMEDR